MPHAKDAHTPQDQQKIRIAHEKAQAAIISKFGVVAPYNKKSRALYDKVYESTLNGLHQFNG